MEEAFVYKWTDNATGKMYIGSHKGTEDDGYICSSKLMLEQYKERRNDFTREILFKGNNHKEIVLLERKMLREVDARNNPLYYNQTNGNSNYTLKHHTKAHNERFIKARSRMWKVEYPDGKIEIVQNLKQFSKDNNLDYRNFHRILYGPRRKSHRGYKLLERLTWDLSKDNEGNYVHNKINYRYN